MDCAILRPMESDGDHFLAYYLTEDDDTAVQFKVDRSHLPINGSSEDEVSDVLLHAFPCLICSCFQTAFHFVRDYEVVKVEQEVPNEFLLVIDEGDEDVKDVKDVKPESSASAVKRHGPGIYYKGIERKMLLKKKRVNVSGVPLWLLESF